MLPTILRAIFARRLPLTANASSWVSRIRTSASSAATKNPFNTTSARTARIFSPSLVSASPFILKAHLAKDKFQDVRERNNSDLALVSAKDHREPLSAALHALQRRFQTQILFDIKSRAYEIRSGFACVGIRLIQDSYNAQDSRHATPAIARFPHRHPCDPAIARNGEHFIYRCVHADCRRERNRFGDVAHRKTLQVQHAIDHCPFFRRQLATGLLHNEPKLFAIAEEMPGKRFTASPAQQHGGNTFNQPDQRPQQQVNDAEGACPKQTEPVRIKTKEHLRQQVEERVEKKNDDREDGNEPDWFPGQCFDQKNQNHSENNEIRGSVPDENRPQEIFRVLQEFVQYFSRSPARTHLLPHAHAAQGKDACFHAREQEGQSQADGKSDPGQ